MGFIRKPNKAMFLDWRGYVAAVIFVAIATWLKLLAQPEIIPADVPILYILAIVPTAIFFGLGPAIFVAILSVFAYDYFFIPPLHTPIELNNIPDAPILGVFLVVGVILSFLSANLRQKTQEALQEIDIRKKAEADLEKYQSHLEDLIKQRTGELEKSNLDLKREISERRQAEENLSQAMQRLDAHMDNSPLAVIEFDSEFRVIRWSKESERVFGWTSEEILGHLISQMKWVFEDDIEEVNRVSDGFMSGRTPRTLNVNRNYRKDGSIIVCEWYNSAFYDPEGKMSSVLSLVLDITQRRLAEDSLKKYTQDLESANQELEAFSYSVSHDLRAPLRTLDGFSQILLEDCGDKLGDQNKDLLIKIRHASQVMSQLIDDLLRLSRIGRAQMNFSWVDLSEMARSIVEALRSSDPARDARIVIAPGMRARGDSPLLKIMLQNLLENAWKYTGRCDVSQIEFGVRHSSEDKVFFIRDNGAGFDMNYADNLFQPFQRLHSSKEFSGSGIGLAIAQRAARRHGGRIWAEAEVGKGATFYFTIP